MSPAHAVRVFILAAIAALIFGAHALAPPPPSASGAFGRGPTIVLVHGLGSDAEHWLPTARLLAHKNRVVLVDLPGHGMTAMPAPFSLEQAVASLDAAIAREGSTPVILVGHSLGGL